MITCQSVVTSTTTWAGINGPWNLRDWSLPSIIVRGPAVTQNKSQLVHVMNEVWYSDAFAPKFVLRKVFSINIYMSCIWTRKTATATLAGINGPPQKYVVCHQIMFVETWDKQITWAKYSQRVVYRLRLRLLTMLGKFDFNGQDVMVN